jgi:hypothetical protein
MTNNVVEGSFQIFLHEKVIFHFLSAINQYFCEGATKIFLDLQVTIVS